VLIAAISTYAQGGPSTFELVENKGQWDDRVQFKGEMLPAIFIYIKMVLP